MVASNKKTAEEDKIADVPSKDVENPTVGQGDVETSEGSLNKDVPSSPEKVEKDSVEEKYDDYFDDDLDGDFLDNVPNSVGTVREGDFDVPYTYLSAGDFDDEVVRTSDTDDVETVKWNVQSTLDDGETPVALVLKEATPGQTFTLSELPDPEVMRANGINPAQYLSGLPVRAELTDEPRRRGIPA